jgi:uncharacterized protein (DUF983 family)
MSVVASINRTLDQELVQLLRGISLECLVCGEFVLFSKATAACPECGFRLRDRKTEEAGLQLGLQAG